MRTSYVSFPRGFGVAGACAAAMDGNRSPVWRLTQLLPIRNVLILRMINASLEQSPCLLRCGSEYCDNVISEAALSPI